MALDGAALVCSSFLVLAASPGPANLSLAATSMAHGRRAGLAMAMGLSLGLAAWGLVAALGLATVLELVPGLLVVVKLLGGAYLLCLAGLSARAAMRPQPVEQPPAAVGHMLRRGLALNLLNPKAVLAWSASLSLGLGDTAVRLPTVVALCALLGLAAYVGHALVFSLGGAMALYRRARRAVEAATAALLGGGGLGLLVWQAR